MSIIESYNKFVEANSDPRTKDWWMMSGITPLLILLTTYVYFCSSLGQKYMRDRKPYNLKHVLRIYNVSQVLMSVFLVYEGLMSGWLFEYSFSCQPVDFSNSPTGTRMAACVWWYFFAKLTELLDTIFFVLRKKNNQVSFLHLYHHTLMPICAWIGCKYLAGGHGTLMGLINSFIHIIMYAYYFLSCFGDETRQQLWWKKYLTRMQMVQFIIIFLHNVQLLIPGNTCNYPKVIAFLLTANAGYFFYLFGSFYLRTYLKPKAKEQKLNPTPIAKDGSNGYIKNGNNHGEIVENGGKYKELTQNGDYQNGSIVQNGHNSSNGYKKLNGHNGTIQNGYHSDEIHIHKRNRSH